MYARTYLQGDLSNFFKEMDEKELLIQKNEDPEINEEGIQAGSVCLAMGLVTVSFIVLSSSMKGKTDKAFPLVGLAGSVGYVACQIIFRKAQHRLDVRRIERLKEKIEQIDNESKKNNSKYKNSFEELKKNLKLYLKIFNRAYLNLNSKK